MENRASRTHGNSFVRFDPEIMPSPLGGPCRMGHVVGEPFAEAEITRAALRSAWLVECGLGTISQEPSNSSASGTFPMEASSRFVYVIVSLLFFLDR